MRIYLGNVDAYVSQHFVIKRHPAFANFFVRPWQPSRHAEPHDNNYSWGRKHKYRSHTHTIKTANGRQSIACSDHSFAQKTSPRHTNTPALHSEHTEHSEHSRGNKSWNLDELNFLFFESLNNFRWVRRLSQVNGCPIISLLFSFISSWNNRRRSKK